MSTLQDRVKEDLIKRRQKILDGGINSIPSPFVRFRTDFLGVEQGKYYVITASTKASKTQFTSYTFLYTPLLFAYHNPDKVRLKIFYYALEETPEDVMRRFMSHLIYELSNGTIEVSPEDLRSSRNDKPLSQEVLDFMEREDYKNIISFFENSIIFSTSENPTGVYKECKEYAEEHGTVHYKKVKVKDELGIEKEVDKFDFYEPDDADEYKIIIYDHVSLISAERGLTLKQSIDKLSEYCVLLRNRYGFSPVVIQQQAFAGESLDAFKENKIRPTVANLSDSKYPSRDCNMCIGLFSPYKHELPDYKGYNISILKDNVRFAEILINRGGQQGGLIALYFNGAVCDWRELPPPNDTTNISKWYSWLQNKRGNKSLKSFFMRIKIILNR